jgi:2-(1,2-epoxy-1,2-dihydrophenyl)acetyl-CoA isomerase
VTLVEFNRLLSDMNAINTQENSILLFTIEKGIARITFNRPTVLNAIDAALANAFLTAIRAIESEPEVRVIVMKGAGKGFMAGGDVGAFHADLPNAGATADAIIGPLHEGLALMARLPQPVLASLHGAVAGAGVSLAMSCDLAIAADNARFTLAYSRIGASLDGSSSWFLPRIVGLRKAMELALTAETIDANEALRLNMVNRVVPAADLEAETEALARRLADGPTFAFGRIKALLRQSFDTPLVEQLAAEQAGFRACAGTNDFAEGLNAFFEKRPAVFKGR